MGKILKVSVGNNLGCYRTDAGRICCHALRGDPPIPVPGMENLVSFDVGLYTLCGV